ncbi:MAG: hypothetical protein JSW11_17505 [Candidatus Heimdallarchaeota archaeon]|nr:MAG: hypothetical protein JSW11_17505 [Candidatus Heimdallarchaeota archaeon]
MEDLAWQTMIVSLFRQTERQTLNLILSIVGVTTPEDATTLINNIFRLVRKSIIYIPEARLKIIHDAPEMVDVYLIKAFDEAMKELAQELDELRGKVAHSSKMKQIPQKVLIDLENYASGKYIERFHFK